MLLQTKIINGFFSTAETGLCSKTYLLNGLDITMIQLAPRTGFWLGSVVDPQYTGIQDRLDLARGTNKALLNYLNNYGIRLTDLDAIQINTDVESAKIRYVFGGTNLFWQNADAVFYQNKYDRKTLSPQSPWYGKPLYYFTQDKSGDFNLDLLDENNFPEDLNIAVSGRPVLLAGETLNLYKPLANGLSPLEHFFLEKGDPRHLVRLPRLKKPASSKDEQDEDFFLGFEYFWQNPAQLLEARQGQPITLYYNPKLFSPAALLNNTDNYGLPCWYASNQYELDLEHGTVYFPRGLDRGKYSHNVLAIDWNNNAYIIQFHGKSGQKGPTIEELQDYLIELNIKSAIVTSNGLDVFVYDARNNCYFSHSREYSDVVARKDRLAQHLLFVHERQP
jgi:hypothetical protein